MTKTIPTGYHTVTPSFTFKDSLKAIEFYKKAFSAEVLNVAPAPGGRGTMHAVIQIGDSLVMMGDENPGQGCKSAETLGGSPITLFVYVPDVDMSFKQAVDAGGKSEMPVEDMFWGDRAGSIRDPFGYSWMLATHKQDLTADQIQKGAADFFTKMAQK